MSKQNDVVHAVLALVKSALPAAEVVGLDAEAAVPGRISPLGRVIVRRGDPGEPEIDLSPLTYNYEHPIPIEIAALPAPNVAAADAVDAMLGAIGAAVVANRTLGGLVEFLEAHAPEIVDVTADNAVPAAGADLRLTAFYATTDPLN